MLAALILGVLLGADAAGYQLSARSETRSGSVGAAGVPSPSLDEQFNILAGVFGTSGRMRGDLSYAPSLTYDFRSKGDPDVLHRGFATGPVRTSTGPGISSTILSAGLGLDHRFSTATVGTLGTGASLSRDETSGVTNVAPVRPTAAAGITHSELVFGRKVVSAARVAVDTAIDPFGGRTYSRVEGSLSVGFVPLRDLSFQVRGSGAGGLPNRPELRNGLWQVEGTSSYAFARGMDVSLGCRTAFADAAATPQLQGTQWSAFLTFGFAYAGRI